MTGADPIAPAVPVLETERLILRAPTLADYAAYSVTLRSERARGVGGPFDAREAWRDYCEIVADWLLRGFGAWAMEEKATGRFAGVVMLHHPAYQPEPELGWILQAEAEGRGLAHEAARRVRDYGFAELGLTTLVSYIDAGNFRSIRLAERLGARLDPDAPRIEGEDCLIYRHPAPGAAVAGSAKEAAP